MKLKLILETPYKGSFLLIYLILKTIFPPIQAIGIYASIKSVKMNHFGAGKRKEFMIPPIKKKTPITIANIILLFAAITADNNEPTNGPKACG